MHKVDYAILVLYLLVILAISAFSHRGQKSTGDFLLAGRSMPWPLVGISLVASFISGISYIGIPAEIRSYGIGYIIYALAYVLVIPVVLCVFIPFYSNRLITTAYEYLEKRFNIRVRRLASGMFVFWRLLWIATVIYVPSLVLSSVAAIPLLSAVLLIGILTTLYTAFGGMKAVIWTDFSQFFVMFGGALLAIGFVVHALPNGVHDILQAAMLGGRTSLPSLSLNPTVRITLWGALIGGFFANLSLFGVDQLVIQRYFTTKSAVDLRRTYLLNCFALLIAVGTLTFLGLALFAFYEQRPLLLPDAVPSDQVFPWFIAHEFPPGLTGLLVASILAATMSALSAGINAVSTALFSDFLKSGNLAHARLLTFVVGISGTILASMVSRLGTIIEISVRLIDGFAGPLLGIFLVGIFTRTVYSGSIFIAALLGVILTGSVNFFTNVSFMWYSPIGCVTTVVAALALRAISGRPNTEHEKLATIPNAY